MPGRLTRVYVGGLFVLAVALGILSVPHVTRWLDVLCFGLLFLFSEQLKSDLKLGGGVAASLTSVASVATYPVLGAWGALAVLCGLLAFRSRAPVVRRVYNVSQNVLCTFAGGLVYVGLGGDVGGFTSSSFPYVLVPVTAATLCWHLLNLALLATVLRFDAGVGLVRSIRSIPVEAFISSVGYSYLGFLLAILWLGQLRALAAVLLLPPLLVANWAFAQYGAEQKAHQATLQALAQAIETKDLYTRGHGERVSKAARMLGSEVGWDGERLDALAEAGLLHDVGKIGVPTRVLQKDGRLTEDEFDSIKLHPLHGVEVVGDIAFLEDARAGIMHHHERYDGNGYPSGLQGEDIPVFARMLSIADAFDCMTSVRSYRPARPIVEAIDELVRCRGQQFDPALVDVFVTAVGREGWVPTPVQDLPEDTKAPTYDHDDPAHPPQVEGSPGSTS